MIMTIQSLFLNSLYVNSGSKFNSLNTTFLLTLFSGCWSFLITPSAIAQNAPQINDRLPPPPPVPSGSRQIQGNRITRGISHDILRPANIKPPTYESNNSGREYTFSAPKSESAVSNAASYSVEVLGNSDHLLEQVRSIEPKAFLKGDIIQVGIFSEQNNAANLVRQLTFQGLWARIVTK